MTDLEPVRHYVDLLTYCKQKRAEINEIEAVARAAVQSHLGDDESGVLDGHETISWKSSKRTALDQKILKQRFPEVHAECMATSEVRRFVVNE